MLRELHIKNYAIIDEVALTLADGFSVITGETGAGKSILVDALSLLLGERSSLDGLREGAKETLLEGSFDPLPLDLSETGSDPNDLILKRVLVKSGKNRAYINDAIKPLSSIKNIAQKLVEIHGQQGHILLTDLDIQLDLVDAFCHLMPDRRDYQAVYRQWKALKADLEDLVRKSAETDRQKSIIEYQLSEIREADLSINEEEDLEREAEFMKNWESISTYTQEAYERLNDDDGILRMLNEVATAVKDLDRMSQAYASERDLCEQSQILLKELAAQLRARLNDADFQPERLEAVSARLYQIQRIKKKMQRSVAEIIEEQKVLEKALADLSDEDVHRQEIEDQIGAIEKDLLTQAAALAKKRSKGMLLLKKKVKETLDTLGMEKTQFEVAHRQTALSLYGTDQIEFLIALPGETPQNLSKVASGGELSRIMLALKVVLAEVDPVPTLVFDEVDAGIGGGIAERVGRRLSALSKQHQVLCITHLPQIASLADHHYFVEKKITGQRVVTSIRALSKKERVDELARMLGGLKITSITRRHAEEMMGSK